MTTDHKTHNFRNVTSPITRHHIYYNHNSSGVSKQDSLTEHISLQVSFEFKPFFLDWLPPQSKRSQSTLLFIYKFLSSCILLTYFTNYLEFPPVLTTKIIHYLMSPCFSCLLLLSVHSLYLLTIHAFISYRHGLVSVTKRNKEQNEQILPPSHSYHDFALSLHKEF